MLALLWWSQAGIATATPALSLRRLCQMLSPWARLTPTTRGLISRIMVLARTFGLLAVISGPSGFARTRPPLSRVGRQWLAPTSLAQQLSFWRQTRARNPQPFCRLCLTQQPGMLSPIYRLETPTCCSTSPTPAGQRQRQRLRQLHSLASAMLSAALPVAHGRSV